MVIAWGLMIVPWVMTNLTSPSGSTPRRGGSKIQEAVASAVTVVLEMKEAGGALAI